MVCLSESSSDYLNPTGYVCFKKKLGYFLVVKKQATEMNVHTEHCCSLALSPCHAAACRCCFVQEHAIPLITKSVLGSLQAEEPAPSACCHWNVVPVQTEWAVLAAISGVRGWPG